MSNIRTPKQTAFAESLARLGAARRERLTKQDYEVFVDGLAGFEAATVAIACDRLAKRPRGEFEPSFPTLATLLETCAAVAKERDMRKQLNAAPLEDQYPPMSAEQKADLMAKFQAVLREKVMPGGRLAAAGKDA